MSNEEKIQKIHKLVKELNLGFGSPAGSGEIERMESELNIKFPKEYKEFLETFGFLGTILGVECEDISAVKETLRYRKRRFLDGKQKPFAKNLVVVEEDGLGNCYCVVCNEVDEGKVIFWQHDVYPEDLYPNHPLGKPDFWIEGPDFWSWLLRKLQDTKNIKDEEDNTKKEEIAE